MVRTVSVPLRCALFVLLVSAIALQAPGQPKKRLTFDQIFKGAEPRLTSPLPLVTGWADEDHYLE